MDGLEDQKKRRIRSRKGDKKLSLFIFAAFDSYSIARRGFGILFDKREA